MYQLALSRAVSVLFRDIVWAVGRTSEVELALVEWVEVGEGCVDQFGREAHRGL